MTNPTDHENDRPRWWLDLDDGEQLLVLDVPDGGWETYDPRESVVLKMPALRAYDLSRVLDLYSRLMALFYESGQVSATEHALSSALRDAGRTLEGRDRDEPRPEPHRVTSAARLRAMAVLQANRPWLDHRSLIGVVDAAARWVDEQEDDLAQGVLDAAGGDEAGLQAWLILLGRDQPPAGGSEQSEGLSS
jgi:hypothetical protein